MKTSRLCTLAATLAILLLASGCARKADPSALPAAKVPEAPARAVQAVPETAPLTPGDFMFIRQKDGLKIPIAGRNAGPGLEKALGPAEKREVHVGHRDSIAHGARDFNEVDAWYPGLWIHYVDDVEDGIWWITVTGPGYVTPRGIGIGSTEAELKAVYGSALRADWGPKKERPLLHRGMVPYYMTYGSLLFADEFAIESFINKEAFIVLKLDKEDRVTVMEIVRPL